MAIDTTTFKYDVYINNVLEFEDMSFQSRCKCTWPVTVDMISNAPDIGMISLVGNAAGQIEVSNLTITSALEVARTAAKAEVNGAFAAYNVRSYPTSFWNDLVGIKDAAIEAIDAAADTAEIDTLKTTALTDMAEIKSWKLYSEQTEPVKNLADVSGVGPSEDTSYMLDKIYSGNITINFDMMALDPTVDANVGFMCGL